MARVEIEVGYQDTRNPANRDTRWSVDAVDHTWWTFTVELQEVLPIERIGDAVFLADNCPFPAKPDSLVGQISEQMQLAYMMTQERHHSCSIGDRVRVGEVEAVCAPDGWNRVEREGARL